MRQVTELRFEVPAGRWSLYLSPPPLELAPFVKGILGGPWFRELRQPTRPAQDHARGHIQSRATAPPHASWRRCYRSLRLGVGPAATAVRGPTVFRRHAFTVPAHRGEPTACWRICVFGIPMDGLTNDLIELDMLTARAFQDRARAKLLEMLRLTPISRARIGNAHGAVGAFNLGGRPANEGAHADFRLACCRVPRSR